MFCPECKAEYQLGFTRCSDCQVELVEELKETDSVEASEVPGSGGSDYVVIANASGAYEDSQICSFLDANGIPAQIRSNTQRKPYSMGIWPVQIVVPREFAFAARQLLEKADRGVLEIEEE